MPSVSLFELFCIFFYVGLFTIGGGLVAITLMQQMIVERGLISPEQFYNMVDTIIVGQFLGINDLAGVGSTGSVNFLVMGFVIGVCAGFAIPVAQKFGSKDFDALKKFVGNTIWIAAVFAAEKARPASNEP